MRFDTARCIDTCRVDRKPALGSFASHKGRAANICHLGNGLFGGEPVCNFNHCAFSIAIQQQVALTIDHDRAAHLVRPIVVMCDAPQRALDTA